MITIRTTDLIYLNEAAKALKQKNVMWISNQLIGIDNFNYIITLPLDINKLSFIPDRGLCFNQKELSAFVKSITTEEAFYVDDTYVNATSEISTITNGMSIHLDRALDIQVSHQFMCKDNIDKRMIGIPEEDMTLRLNNFYGMSKSSGIMLFQYDATHIMTLFAGIFPLLKSDKLNMILMDDSDCTFIVRFHIKKKAFDIYAYLMYLKI